MIDCKPFGCVAVAISVQTETKTSIHCGTGNSFTREHHHCTKARSFDTMPLCVYCVISRWVLPLRHQLKGAYKPFCAVFSRGETQNRHKRGKPTRQFGFSDAQKKGLLHSRGGIGAISHGGGYGAIYAGLTIA